MFKEFREFAMRGNVVDLAVGFILGGAFSTIVKSLVEDVLMPPLGLLLGGVDFQNLFLALDGSDYASLAEAQAAGAATVNYGLFINNLIAFVILAAALFFLVKGMNSLQRLKQDQAGMAPQEIPPAKPRQEELLEEIRDALRTAGTAPRTEG